MHETTKTLGKHALMLLENTGLQVITLAIIATVTPAGRSVVADG